MKKLITLAFGAALVPGLANADMLIHSGRLIDGESYRAFAQRTNRVASDTIVGI